jgi:hypothetical protein
MSDINTLPEQIIEDSRAFTETLGMENRVFQSQLNGAISMTVEALRELIALCKESVEIGKPGNAAQGQQKLADTAQQALSNVENAAGQATTAAKNSAGKAPASADELDVSVVHAVSMSYMNAVNAQQQTYILQQAATTQIIATILSLATAALGVAVKEAESGSNQ